MFQHGDLVLRQECLDRQGVVCRRVVLVKIPWDVLPHFRSSSCHPFTKFCQNLVVDLVNGSQSTWTIPRMSGEKKITIALNFGFVPPWFLWPWWTGAPPMHGLARAFWVVLKKPRFITSFSFLWPCIVSKVWREKTNKMQQLDVYY